jgi:hypothetical protein
VIGNEQTFGADLSADELGSFSVESDRIVAFQWLK